MNDKPILLLVDDEERILRSLAMLFRSTHRVLATTDGRQAAEWARRQTVHVIVCDQRMPLLSGAEVLRQVRQASPNTLRILLTGYSDLAAIVDSVNEGEIFRFVNKPWDAQALRDVVMEATRIAEDLFAEIPPLAVAGLRVAERVLVIDEDEAAVRAVRETIGAHHPVSVAHSLDEAMAALEAQEFGVVVSELVVGGESVTTLLKMLKADHPALVTLVMTPFTDVSVFVGLINQGQVFRFLPKPIRRKLLESSLHAALVKHRSLRESAVQRAAHRVERVQMLDQPGIAQRVGSFLERLRTRAVQVAGRRA